MPSAFKRGPATPHTNLTPMIDVTFLLIIFFVLVSQIVEVENVDLELPHFEKPASALSGEEQRVVMNVVPGPGGRVLEYRIGARGFPPGDAGLALLTDHLASLMTAAPAMRINLRADQRTEYVGVQPVLRAVVEAAGRVEGGRAAPRVNLVVVREE